MISSSVEMNDVLEMVEVTIREVSVEAGEVAELCGSNSDSLVCKTIGGLVESAKPTIGEVGDVELSVI